jgi:hypothetical protein
MPEIDTITNDMDRECSSRTRSLETQQSQQQLQLQQQSGDETTTIDTTKPKKVLYLLSLLQMYQSIYAQYISTLYRNMIWNLTVARRTILSRSSSTNNIVSNGTYGTLAINAIHLPSTRTFSAQYRVYYDNSEGTKASSGRGKPKLIKCNTDGTIAHINEKTTSESKDEIDSIHDQNEPRLRSETVEPVLAGRDGDTVQSPSKSVGGDDNNDDDITRTIGLRQRRRTTGSELNTPKNNIEPSSTSEWTISTNKTKVITNDSISSQRIRIYKRMQ